MGPLSGEGICAADKGGRSKGLRIGFGVWN